MSFSGGEHQSKRVRVQGGVISIICHFRFWHKADMSGFGLLLRKLTSDPSFRRSQIPAVIYIVVWAMRRRDFIQRTAVSAAWPLAVRAQDAGRAYRVGMLFPFPHDDREAVAIVEAFTVMLVAAHNYDHRHARSHGMRTAYVNRPSEYGLSQTKDTKAEDDWDIVVDSFTAFADILIVEGPGKHRV